MFFWNFVAFLMIQQMLAIWSLVPLPFLNPAWTSGSSQFTYCWSLAWRILSITFLVCEMSAFCLFLFWLFMIKCIFIVFSLNLKISAMIFISANDYAVVCSGFHNKISYTEWLKQQKFISHSVLLFGVHIPFALF